MTSITVEEFCRAHGISRAYFYKLLSQGEAPRTFKVGRLTRISQAANDAWVRAREAAGLEAVA